MPAARLVLVALAALLIAAVPAAASAPSSARLVAVTTPPPEHLADPGLKTYVYRFGPHRIGPYQVATATDTVSPPPVDGAIVAMDTRLVTPAGVEVPQSEVMLHHIVYTDGGPDGRRRDGACPQRPVFQRFFGTSEELRPLTLPRGYGYRITARDRWRTSWMVMNHQSPNRDALLEYRVTVDPRPAIAPVMPFWLSVLPCRRSPDPSTPSRGAARPARRTSSRAPGSSPPAAGSSRWAGTCTAARAT